MVGMTPRDFRIEHRRFVGTPNEVLGIVHKFWTELMSLGIRTLILWL
jgi:hypothetical protein